ncbi:MAG: peptide chain release factor 2 [Candidatus Omnitrophica bacterium]|nr:peptide chain release factor 2 [Candidatus Omnitrophota bacterium]
MEIFSVREDIEKLKEKLAYLKGKLQEIRGYFDLDAYEKEIAALNDKMGQPGFWDRPQEAQDTVERLKSVKKIIDPWRDCDQRASEMGELLTLLDENQAESLREMEADMVKLERDVETVEFQRLLSDPLDKNSAIVSINAGAGGTESCDWASMLLRMYLRWAEAHGYRVSSVDGLPGEEAGIKNTTFMVEGPYAYGYLKAESGVHRLVRISPFDANKRRHTSFASVDVIAEVEDAPEIEIKESDIRIDAFRAGGAGGQHVNKTSSAIRITHLATGIVSQCQNERSQHQNKQVAMKILKARLYERYRREKESAMLAQYGEKKKIEWGSQIRSYVLHPYSMVKDHRTDAETSNTQAVMDGDLEMFIQAYLKQFAGKGSRGEGK